MKNIEAILLLMGSVLIVGLGISVNASIIQMIMAAGLWFATVALLQPPETEVSDE